MSARSPSVCVVRLFAPSTNTSTSSGVPPLPTSAAQPLTTIRSLPRLSIVSIAPFTFGELLRPAALMAAIRLRPSDTREFASAVAAALGGLLGLLSCKVTTKLPTRQSPPAIQIGQNRACARRTRLPPAFGSARASRVTRAPAVCRQQLSLVQRARCASLPLTAFETGIVRKNSGR